MIATTNGINLDFSQRHNVFIRKSRGLKQVQLIKKTIFRRLMMFIRYICDNCGQKYKSDDEYAGRKVKCTQCGTLLVIPKPENLPVHPIEVRDPPPAMPPLVTEPHVKPQPETVEQIPASETMSVPEPILKSFIMPEAKMILESPPERKIAETSVISDEMKALHAEDVKRAEKKIIKQSLLGYTLVGILILVPVLIITLFIISSYKKVAGNGEGATQETRNVGNYHIVVPIASDVSLKITSPKGMKEMVLADKNTFIKLGFAKILVAYIEAGAVPIDGENFYGSGLRKFAIIASHDWRPLSIDDFGKLKADTLYSYRERNSTEDFLKEQSANPYTPVRNPIFFGCIFSQQNAFGYACVYPRGFYSEKFPVVVCYSEIIIKSRVITLIMCTKYEMIFNITDLAAELEAWKDAILAAN